MSVLFIQREGFWVAQALERDLAAQGRTLDETKRAFEQTLIGQILFDKQQGREPLAHLGPAPERYREIFLRVATRPMQTEQLHIPDIPPAFMVQAIDESNAVLH